MTELLNIQELIKATNDNELGEAGYKIAEYTGSSSYLCDVLTEIADSMIDCYTYDLLQWLPEHFEDVTEANQEFGMPADGDILTQIRQGQYYYYDQDLYNHLEEIALYYCLNCLDNRHIETITQDQYDELVSYANNVDNNDRLDQLEDYALELVQSEEK